MSGSGRKSGYRKAITDQVLYGSVQVDDNQSIVKVAALRGSNLFDITASDGTQAVAMLPNKFQKLIWLKRGDFVIVVEAGGEVTTAEGKSGAVRYLIEHILYADQIKELKKAGHWPNAFRDGEKDVEEKDSDRQGITMGNGELFVNRNRRGGQVLEESEESDSEEDL